MIQQYCHRYRRDADTFGPDTLAVFSWHSEPWPIYNWGRKADGTSGTYHPIQEDQHETQRM